MEMNFCRRCGTALTDKSGGVFVCENAHTIFANAAPTSGIFFLTDKNEVILSVRGIEPQKGKLDAFGGFVDESETVEGALIREITEEIGLSPNQYDPPQFLCTSVGKYPYDGEARTVLSTLFWSRLKPNAVPVPADDVADIQIIPLDQINLADIGNDDIRDGVQKLQKTILF